MAQTTDSKSATEGTDIISELAGIAPDAPLAAVRAERGDVTRYTQSSYEALLEPDDLGGVSREEREAVALRVAALTGSAPLVTYHRDRLRALGIDAGVVEQFSDGAALSPRLTAILRHTDLLTRTPERPRPRSSLRCSLPVSPRAMS